MLIYAYFGGKNVKIVSASGAPSPDPRVVTPVYYYNFVKFVSTVAANEMFTLIAQKKFTHDFGFLFSYVDLRISNGWLACEEIYSI